MQRDNQETREARFAPVSGLVTNNIIIQISLHHMLACSAIHNYHAVLLLAIYIAIHAHNSYIAA